MLYEIYTYKLRMCVFMVRMCVCMCVYVLRRCLTRLPHKTTPMQGLSIQLPPPPPPPPPLPPPGSERERESPGKTNGWWTR